VFDEYRSQFKIADMLNYLDGYPLELPCRYYDKQACYTTVYIISNIPLERQYPNVQNDEKTTWQAFLRRINNVYNFDDPIQRHKLFDGVPNKNHLYIDPKQIELVPIEPPDDMPF
jgi:tRNA uridine 5-carbamoylmethylation protein Kti12